MSFFGKTMTNRFPAWSRVKFDESSVGSILLDVVGRNLETIRQSGLNYRKQLKVLEDKTLLTYAKSFRIHLPNYPLDIRNKNIQFLNWASGNTNLEIYDTWSSYNLALPDSFAISLKKTLFNNIIATFQVAEESHSSDRSFDFSMTEKHLLIDCREIDYFYNGRTNKNFGKVFDNDEKIILNENHYVVVRGLDCFNKPIEEIIHISKKDIYKTKNRFTKICPLVKESEYIKQRFIVGGPSLEFVGISGKLSLKEYDFEAASFILKDNLSIVNHNPFLTVYPDESYTENHLKIKLVENTKLQNLHSFFKDDFEYYSKDNPYKVDSEEVELSCSRLCSMSGEPIQVDNIAYDMKTKLLYGINSKKDLFLWELGRPKMMHQNFIPKTKSVDIELDSEKRFFNLNETAKLSILLTRPKTAIKNFCIFRYAPSTLSTETDWEVEFLNSDYLWQGDPYFFSGNDRLDRYENIVNFNFKDLLTEYGQYDYYVVSTNKGIAYSDKLDLRTKFLAKIKTNAVGFNCNKTSILVPKMIAIKEYNLNALPTLNPLDKEVYKIDFERYTNELLVHLKDSVYTCSQNNNKLFFNWLEGIAFTQTKYPDLKLEMSFEDGSSYSCEVSYD
jgi:hypothetical protein